MPNENSHFHRERARKRAAAKRLQSFQFGLGVVREHTLSCTRENVKHWPYQHWICCYLRKKFFASPRISRYFLYERFTMISHVCTKKTLTQLSASPSLLPGAVWGGRSSFWCVEIATHLIYIVKLSERRQSDASRASYVRRRRRALRKRKPKNIIKQFSRKKNTDIFSSDKICYV